MKKPRMYISFSSFLTKAEWYTQIDLIAETMRISKDGDCIFKGSMEEFKKLEKLKADETDIVYTSILGMAEELIHILTKK